MKTTIQNLENGDNKTQLIVFGALMVIGGIAFNFNAAYHVAKAIGSAIQGF